MCERLQNSYPTLGLHLFRLGKLGRGDKRRYEQQDHGILVRSGGAIQTPRDVEIVVADKTGTITKGKPGVTDAVSVNGAEQQSVPLLAASAERGSELAFGSCCGFG